KELFARALHDQGPRAGAPFVAPNCGAVPDALFEAELFGHAKGSFTGAERARPGLLARAEGGTLFFDEIGELPLARQVSLLRVLETRTYRPVGSDDERTFDARIVAATHRDLGREVEKGTFRADLLFRLNVVEVRIPSLRERRSDVPLLVRAFEEKLGRSLSLSAEARAAIASYDFPGNVRELLHLLERLSILRTRVEWSHLPRELRRHAPAPLARDRIPASGDRASPLSPVVDEPAPAPLGAVTGEHREVERALAASGGNITHAAESLGLTRHGLKKRMVRLGLRPAKKDPS
ncbi:MAG: sigma-54-dependent Fis family transcriptional regulator, partial [Polyangiaceae bacterium]|nr:sigma-54-dependent Fis family transcriptional regulator [Polyangiaceae bacterium]